MTKAQKQKAALEAKGAASAIKSLNYYPRRFMDPEGKIQATPAQYENAPYEEKFVYLPKK